MRFDEFKLVVALFAPSHRLTAWIVRDKPESTVQAYYLALHNMLGQ